MARVRYISPVTVGNHPRIQVFLPDPDLLEIPAIQEAVSAFRRLDQAVTESWAALAKAQEKRTAAEHEDQEARVSAIREGRPVKDPMKRFRAAQAALEEAEAVHRDTLAVREEAADALAEVVLTHQDTIRERVEELSAPMAARLAELAQEALPLRANLRALEAWTELDEEEPGYNRGRRLGPVRGSAEAVQAEASDE